MPQATSSTFVPRLEMEPFDELFRSMGIQLCNFTEVAGHPGGSQPLFQLRKTLRQTRHDCLLYDIVEKVYGKDVMWPRATRPRGSETGEDASSSCSWISAGNLGLHVGMLEVLVFQRHRHRAIEKEERADAKFAAQAGGKPDAIVLSPVMNREAEAGQVGAQKFSDAERQGLRELRKHVNRLELLRVDIGLARPIRVLVVLRSESDVVSLAPFERLVVDEAKLVAPFARRW